MCIVHWSVFEFLMMTKKMLHRAHIFYSCPFSDKAVLSDRVQRLEAELRKKVGTVRIVHVICQSCMLKLVVARVWGKQNQLCYIYLCHFVMQPGSYHGPRSEKVGHCHVKTIMFTFLCKLPDIRKDLLTSVLSIFKHWNILSKYVIKMIRKTTPCQSQLLASGVESLLSWKA